MKHFFILSLSCLALFFSACSQKEYTCHCDGGVLGAGADFQIGKTSKSNAKAQCRNREDGFGTPDGYSNCKLK